MQYVYLKIIKLYLHRIFNIICIDYTITIKRQIDIYDTIYILVIRVEIKFNFFFKEFCQFYYEYSYRIISDKMTKFQIAILTLKKYLY